MKNSGVCPKCASKDILRIPGQAGAYGVGNNIPLGSFVFNYVKVARYLCIDCGFSEEWIENREDILRLKRKYSK